MGINPTETYASIVRECRLLLVPDVPFVPIPELYDILNRMLVTASAVEVKPNINSTIPLDIYEKLGNVFLGSILVPFNLTIPIIIGMVRVGFTLTTSDGSWSNSPASYTYQWNKGGTPIGGANSQTYVPVVGDLGSVLSVSVVAINSGGSSAPATSSSTAFVVSSGGSGLSIGADVDVGSIPIGL